jgi:hypothetical protein
MAQPASRAAWTLLRHRYAIQAAQMVDDLINKQPVAIRQD